MNIDKKLDDYAKLLVEVGINVQKGEPLFINSPVEGVEFTRLLAKHAYNNGCSEVYINWYDDALSRMKFENAPNEVFEIYPSWKSDMLVDFAKRGAGFLSLTAEDPQLLKGIDMEKIAAANKAAAIGMQEYRTYTMADKVSWCVASIPTTTWAKRVFPHLSEKEAVEKLWEAIFEATRVNTGDAVKAWKEHLDNLEEKVKFLNDKRFKSLHYTASNGTDLHVELPEGHLWAGGGGNNAKGDYFVANMPTEEVFTMPHKYGVHGVVHSSKPLNYGGNLIDGFKLVFENGEVVSYSAEKGEELLKDILDTDTGSKHLGEVALVPFSSPIEQAGILFMKTLFDENASCHFALGKAYPTCIEGGNDMNKEQSEAAGVNDSIAHEDFMIGTKDLSVIGTTHDGEKIQVFKDGEWAI